MTDSVAFGRRSTADQVLAGIDLNGKRIVVTGCNSGMGFELMNALAANGAHVFGLARTLEAATRACAAVAFNCTPLACDLADVESIQEAVQSIRLHPGPVDAIIANGGIAYLPALHTRYGVELQFLVNHLGHFALIKGLTDLLRDGSARVVLVSDRASHTQGPAAGIMFDNLAGQRFYNPAAFYGQSKFANALYAVELARRLQSRGICANAVDPGAMRGTRLLQHLPPMQRLSHKLAGLFVKSAAQGAASAAMLAASPSTNGVTGEYWANCRSSSGHALLHDRALAQRLWEVSEQLLECRSAAPERPTKSNAAIHRAA